MQGVVQRRGKMRGIVVDVQRHGHQRVTVGIAFLDDLFLGRRDSRAHRPHARQLARERDPAVQRPLVIRLQRLLDGFDRDLQRLVAMADVGQREGRADIVAQTCGRAAAAQIDDGRLERKLLRVAENVAIGPGHAAAGAQIAGVGPADTHRVSQPLAEFEGDRHAARFVGLVAELDGDGRERCQTQQIPAGPFDGRGVVLLPRLEQEPAAHQPFVKAFESFQPDLTDLDPGAGVDFETHVEERLARILVGHRRIDPGEGIALLLQCREQAVTGVEDVRRNGRRAGLQREDTFEPFGKRTVERDAAQVIQRAQFEGQHRMRGLPLRQSGQDVGKRRIVEAQIVDLHGDRGLVVAVALQYGLQTIALAARAGDEPERTHRRRFLQRVEF